MKLTFSFIVGRSEECPNKFGEWPYAHCTGCFYGVEYPEVYACACPTFDTQIYPRCYVPRTSDRIMWRKL